MEEVKGVGAPLTMAGGPQEGGEWMRVLAMECEGFGVGKMDTTGQMVGHRDERKVEGVS